MSGGILFPCKLIVQKSMAQVGGVEQNVYQKILAFCRVSLITGKMSQLITGKIIAAEEIIVAHYVIISEIINTKFQCPIQWLEHRIRLLSKTTKPLTGFRIYAK